MPDLVPCFQCGNKVRADKLALHQQRAHGWLTEAVGKSKLKATTAKMAQKARPPGKNRPAKAQRPVLVSPASRTVRITHEAFISSFLKRHANDPRKCSLPNCANIVIPPIEICEPCKAKALKSRQTIGSGGQRQGSCRTCGANTVPGENYCYDCLGD